MEQEANPTSDTPGGAVDRRGLLMAAAGAVAATAVAATAQAAGEGDPTTPITDILDKSEAAILTPRARKLTEGDAIRLNRWMRNPNDFKKPPVEGLTLEDVQSLTEAFEKWAHRSHKVKTSSLAPGLATSAYAASCCCTCTPASCCTAAAETRPIRSRRIV